MMKNIKILMAFALLLAFSACEEDRAFLEFDELEKGAFPRLLDGVNGEFNFFDPSGSSVDFTVEFYDENQGQDVVSYAWTATYIDRATNTLGNPVDIVTYTTSDFKPEPTSGLPSVTVTITFQQVLDALGLTTDQIKGGDAIRMQGALTKSDGKVFTANNTSSGILSNGPAFGAWFIFDQNIVCPSDLGGTFDYVHTNMLIGPDANPCGPAELTGTVTWEDLGSGVYKPSDLSFGQYASCWSDAPAVASDTRITDACGNMGIVGGDQYGLTYTYEVVSIDGPVLSLKWSNSYNDFGDVVLTRQDGKDWPAISF